MKKKNGKVKAIVASVLVVICTGTLVGYKLYTKPHINVEDAKSLNVTAMQLSTSFENNEQAANRSYLDKVIEVSGTVESVSKNMQNNQVITLAGTTMSGVICTVDSDHTVDVKAGDRVRIKGICTGYLTDVVLVRCVVDGK